MGSSMAVVEYVEGEISTIQINRPEKHNALDRQTLLSLQEKINLADSNKACKAVVISGAGGKAFSAGADLNYLLGAESSTEAEEIFDLFYRVTNSIWSSEKIFVAAISGYCMGGGNELAIACDFRIASPDSIFSQPEVKFGIPPGGGATYRLEKIIGLQRARDMILTARTVSADEALRIGLIDRISHDAVSESINFCKSAVQNAPGISYAKRSINGSIKLDQSSERSNFVKALLSEEAKSKISGFVKPHDNKS
jgi:enoyl-CoA hydratase